MCLSTKLQILYWKKSQQNTTVNRIVKVNIIKNLWPDVVRYILYTRILLSFYTLSLLLFLSVEQTFLSMPFIFQVHLLPVRPPYRPLLYLAVKTAVFFSIFQISGCGDGCCWTTTHQPLHSQSCTFWSCGWGPSTWNTGSRTPAEASWCSTIWASHSCPSTCSMR